MTKEERHNLILDYLMQHNSVLVSDLSAKLNVSSVTIRKDLTELEKEKKLQETTLALKKKFGKNAVLKGMNLEEGATGRQRNKTIGGHKA